MKIDVLTLFPDMYTGIINESIISRAVKNKLVEINIHNFREYSKEKNTILYNQGIKNIKMHLRFQKKRV